MEKLLAYGLRPTAYGQLENQARTGSARRATVRSAEPEPGADEPGHDWYLMAGSRLATHGLRLSAPGGVDGAKRAHDSKSSGW